MNVGKPIIIAVIPARLESTRLPRKVLLPVVGKPLIQRVYENAQKSKLVNQVYVATDSTEVYDAVENFGGKCLMTPSKGIFSGSDRVAYAARDIDHDIIVNVQGDEPFMTGPMIDEVVTPMIDDRHLQVCTLCREITKEEEFDDPGVVKVVRDLNENGLYFSRHRIPYPRDTSHNYTLYEHLGIYAFQKDFLKQFIEWKPTPLEITESLEMLRIIEHGIRLKVVKTKEDTSRYLSIDTQEDLDKAIRYMEEL